MKLKRLVAEVGIAAAIWASMASPVQAETIVDGVHFEGNGWNVHEWIVKDIHSGNVILSLMSDTGGFRWTRCHTIAQGTSSCEFESLDPGTWSVSGLGWTNFYERVGNLLLYESDTWPSVVVE